MITWAKIFMTVTNDDGRNMMLGKGIQTVDVVP